MHPSLYFTEQHHQVRDLVRDFAQQVIRPSARRYDLESLRERADDRTKTFAPQD